MEETLEGNVFLREMDEGQIHFRDRLQFALKSEFKTTGGKEPSVYLQEIYLFIPQSLQINQNTFDKADFYHDETNIIRFKTPSVTLKELGDENFRTHPLLRIREDFKTLPSREIIRELKMFGNIYRSSLREEIKNLLSKLSRNSDDLNVKVISFSEWLVKIRETFDLTRLSLEESLSDQEVLRSAQLVDEFLILQTEAQVSGFLYFLGKKHRHLEGYNVLTHALAKLVSRKAVLGDQDDETVLLHTSELNRYLYEALSLKNNRIELRKKHGNYIGMIAAGAAMLVYMILFVWKATTFGINSVPFVLLVVLSYILKDRIKEGLKELYHKNAYRWFPDFSTEINTPDDYRVGFMNESFQFVDPETIQDEFISFRKEGQMAELAPAETIIQYKKELVFTSEIPLELNTIFRFNIHKFLEKAGDEKQRRFIFDPTTETVQEKKLPKVYLLTVILKNTFENHSEIKKFQVVLNKAGIERVQYLGTR